MNFFLFLIPLSFAFKRVTFYNPPSEQEGPLHTSLLRELKEADELDRNTLKELSIAITPEMLHSPNYPIYEPYKLTEAQQLVLLSHE